MSQRQQVHKKGFKPKCLDLLPSFSIFTVSLSMPLPSNTLLSSHLPFLVKSANVC